MQPNKNIILFLLISFLALLMAGCPEPPKTILKITTESPLPDATQGEPYSVTLQATGGDYPFTWSLSSGELPAGLALNPKTGVLSGTPTSAGKFSFKVTVTNSAKPPQSDTKEFQLTVIKVDEVCQITTASPLPNGTVGQPYGPVTLQASCGAGALTWSVSAGALPPGLALSPQGVISQTPNQAGTFNFTVRVTNNANPQLTATKSFQITVVGCEITTASPLPNGTVGQPYGPVTLQASCGAGALTWSVSAGALPPGLALSPQGVISQTPNQAGTFNFTVKVTNNANPQLMATKSFQITIRGRLIVINGRQQGGLRWVFQIDNGPVQDPGGGNDTVIDVQTGDTIEWRVENGRHGVTFLQFAQAQAFLEFENVGEQIKPRPAVEGFGPNAQGTDFFDVPPNPPGHLLKRATVRDQEALQQLEFTCTFHGQGFPAGNMNGRLNK